MPGRDHEILLAVDGEPHSEAAVRWAFDMALARGLGVAAVHVKDPYLKQFENEIYAQGREEYVAHVQACLDRQAEALGRDLRRRAEAQGVRLEFKVLQGDPERRLRAECQRPGYSMVVLGRKQARGFAAWRSGALHARLVAAVTHLPLVLVPAEPADNK